MIIQFEFIDGDDAMSFDCFAPLIRCNDEKNSKTRRPVREFLVADRTGIRHLSSSRLYCVPHLFGFFFFFTSLSICSPLNLS